MEMIVPSIPSFSISNQFNVSMSKYDAQKLCIPSGKNKEEAKQKKKKMMKKKKSANANHND